MSRQRLDSLIVTTGLAENRSKARALIMAGEVTVSGRVITKSGSLVHENSVIEVKRKPCYVGRGGIKLAHALDEFKLNVDSLIAMDIGASTGGFTDCLIQRGAEKVYSIDVGYGQIAYKLRQDTRVTVMDRTNARLPFSLPEKVDLAVVDLSFISVTKVIPNIVGHVKNTGHMIILIKPQFEAKREEVGKGGIIKAPDIHARVLGRFIAWAVDHDLRLGGLTASPIAGAEGNKEFLVLLKVV